VAGALYIAYCLFMHYGLLHRFVPFVVKSKNCFSGTRVELLWISACLTFLTFHDFKWYIGQRFQGYTSGSLEKE